MLASIVANVVSLVLIVGIALMVGFRSSTDLMGWLGVGALLLLFTFALTWLAIIPGLTATSVDGVSGFSYPLVFLPFVSSAFVPTTGMPGPVQWFADHQPITPIVNTLRNLMSAQPVGTEGWVAFAWCLGLLILAYLLAMATYRRKPA